MSHLIRFPEKTIALSPRYYGNISWYAAMAACGKAVITVDGLYDKRRKEVHRCDIADTHGAVQLTVPVSKPHGVPEATWRNVGVSAHGAWWHVHRVTFESAYGRTPFFEFYIDRFLRFLSKGVVERYPTVAELDLAIDAEIRDILMIDTEVSAGDGRNKASVNVADGAALTEAMAAAITPYWQVRGATQGFQSDLSILDLIFNLGPEAPLYLKSVIDAASVKV